MNDEQFNIEDLEIFKKDLFEKYREELNDIYLQLDTINSLHFCEITGIKQHGHIKTRTDKIRASIKNIISQIQVNELNK